MAASIESRVPFLDHHLVEFAFSLPDELKIKGFDTKRILRAAFAEDIPKEILTRPKAGFPVPIKRWFANEYHDVARRIILGDDSFCGANLNRELIAGYFELHRAGKYNYSDQIWTLLNLETLAHDVFQGGHVGQGQDRGMKVLWIKSDFPLPADTGGKIRTRHLLVELAKQAEVTFLCYVTPNHDQRFLAEMRGYGIAVETVVRNEEDKQGIGFQLRVLSKLFSPRPYIVNKYISDEMIARVRELSTPDRCDVVICDFLEMAWCREYVSGVPTVLFEHNVETMIWRRYHEVESNPIKRLYFAIRKKANGKV